MPARPTRPQGLRREAPASGSLSSAAGREGKNFFLAAAGHYSFTARAGIGPMAWLRHGSPRHLDLTARLADAFLDRYLGDGGGEGGIALTVDGAIALRRERP